MAVDGWGWNPGAVSAAATAGGTAVALGVGAIALWQHKQKTRRAKRLARALFAQEVLELSIAAGLLSDFNGRAMLAAGEWPTRRQQKALKVVFIKEHVLTLDVGAVLVEKLARLLKETEMLDWLVADIAMTELPKERVQRAFAASLQASTTLETAARLLEDLHRPSRWVLLKKRVRRWLPARNRTVSYTPSDTPEGM